MDPKTYILLMYPIMWVGSATAAYQTRLLCRYIPSSAWNFKFKLMTSFSVLQIFGAIKLYNTDRVFEWIDCIYLTGITLFIIGLNWFDLKLLKDRKSFIAKAIQWSSRPDVSGDLPPEYWVQSNYTQAVKAIRDHIRPEFLQEMARPEPDKSEKNHGREDGSVQTET